MRIQIAHPITSYLDAINHLLSAQGEDFQTIGATSLSEVLAAIDQQEADVSVIDAVLLRDQPQSIFARLLATAPCHPLIILLDETDENMISDLKTGQNITLLYKRKGYLSSVGDAIRDSYSRRIPKPAVTPAPASSAKPAAAAGEGYFICDRRGRFLSVNKSLQTLTRYSEEEILELSLSDLLNKEEEGTFFQYLVAEEEQPKSDQIAVHLIDKTGNRHPVFFKITLLRDESREQRVIGFRGTVAPRSAGSDQALSASGPIDQNIMVQHLLDMVQMSYNEPINVLLKRIGEVVCQVFGFTRSTVALLDRRKKVYMKQALVGYAEASPAAKNDRPLDVPQDVVDRLFIDKSPLKIIYYNQELISSELLHNPQSTALQTVQSARETQWHPRDLVLLRLADHNGSQFGFISIDEPLSTMTPTASTFHNLELFSMLVSMVVENYYRYSTLDRRNRRLKQIMVNSNIFKLYLSLSELLREVVWSVKFSLEFNLVSLVLISKKTGQLETKAVACDDKIKMSQISELSYDLKDFSLLLREEYRRGKSFLISAEENVLKHFKQIYYGNLSNGHYQDGWPRYALLMVPIKSREGKIIGFLMVDDPGDGRMPTSESVNILEILANQVAIAIDNRMLYVQGKESPQAPSAQEAPRNTPEETREIEESSTGLRRLVDRFLR